MILQEAALNIVVTVMMMAGLPVEDQELQADIYCGAHNIYFEAGSEPFEGMMAIADVTINRKKDTRQHSDYVPSEGDKMNTPPLDIQPK